MKDHRAQILAPEDESRPHQNSEDDRKNDLEWTVTREDVGRDRAAQGAREQHRSQHRRPREEKERRQSSDPPAPSTSGQTLTADSRSSKSPPYWTCGKFGSSSTGRTS